MLDCALAYGNVLSVFFALIGNIMIIHLSLTGPKTPLKQTSEMWGKQLHRA